MPALYSSLHDPTDVQCSRMSTVAVILVLFTRAYIVGSSGVSRNSGEGESKLPPEKRNRSPNFGAFLLDADFHL